MALAEKQVRETVVQDGNTVQSTRQVDSPRVEEDHKKDVAQRVIWYVAGVILSLLALRFVFALLGANAANGFVDFIYGVTGPLVSPFFGIFNYDFTEGVARFEAFTLVAMLIYALIAYGIAKLFTLTRR